MNLINPFHELIRATPDGLNAIEEAARTCYLSEPKDTAALRQEYMLLNLQDLPPEQFITYKNFVRNKFIKTLIRRGHTTPFEFMDIEIEFTCDRGVSHEAVRHRVCSPMQESTRYCNYSADGKHGMNVIPPSFFDMRAERTHPVFNHEGFSTMANKFDVWFFAMQAAEYYYNKLIEMKASPQEARTVLPTSLKTKLKIKANVREWWHIFQLRAINPGAHPQIREVMMPALEECTERWPVLFEHLLNKET